MSAETSLPRIIEAILFASQKPVSFKELAAVFKGAADSAKENPRIVCHARLKPEDVAVAIQQLEAEYAETGRSFEVRESAAGWQLVTRADFAPWLRQLFPENRSAKLSAPALETLAIIAYRQPITRADLEAVRGVAVDGVMQTLLDRGLIRIAGRAEVPGRPLLYDTTQYFMEHFGLKTLDELPNADELRRVALPTATPPPEEKPPELPLGDETVSDNPESEQAVEEALEAEEELVEVAESEEPRDGASP
ncbi:MAG: SMC-Scp complex subunit ScpB [Chthoniobacterales bacterium]|nr:SMC-Scp complex subunit ScpB [Chthoniobacterales bacterium]